MLSNHISKTGPHQTVIDFARTRTILKITLPKERKDHFIFNFTLSFLIFTFYSKLKYNYKITYNSHVNIYLVTKYDINVTSLASKEFAFCKPSNKIIIHYNFPGWDKYSKILYTFLTACSRGSNAISEIEIFEKFWKPDSIWNQTDIDTRTEKIVKYGVEQSCQCGPGERSGAEISADIAWVVSSRMMMWGWSKGRL